MSRVACFTRPTEHPSGLGRSGARREAVDRGAFHRAARRVCTAKAFQEVIST
jgi:hypothetical protein